MYRVRGGVIGSDESYGNNGAFMIPFESYKLLVVASDGEGWEHVTVSLPNRAPNWREMCFIKDLFWDEEDCVVQYHPPKSEYVNNHEYVLPIWRQIGQDFPRPSSLLVGIK
jgi:hypothetical protein